MVAIPPKSKVMLTDQHYGAGWFRSALLSAPSHRAPHPSPIGSRSFLTNVRPAANVLAATIIFWL